MILSHFQVDWRYDWRPSEKVLGFDLSWWNQSPCPAVSDVTSIKSAAKGFPVPFWSLFELKGMKKHVWEAEGSSESPACSTSWLLALPPREILRFTALMFKHENGSPVAAEGTEMLPPCLDGEVGTRGPLRGQREPQKCLQSRWDSQGTILPLALEEIGLSSVTIKTPKDFCARASYLVLSDDGGLFCHRKWMLPSPLFFVFCEAEARSISWRRLAACWEICKAKSSVKNVLR